MHGVLARRPNATGVSPLPSEPSLSSNCRRLMSSSPLPYIHPYLWNYSNMFDKPLLSNFPICQRRQISSGGHNCLTLLPPVPTLVHLCHLSQSLHLFLVQLPGSLSWMSPAMHELSPRLGPWSSLWQPGYLQIF